MWIPRSHFGMIIILAEQSRSEVRGFCNTRPFYLCPLDALQNLVGQQNARYGIIKIFNALQESSANKHLLYASLHHLYAVTPA